MRIVVSCPSSVFSLFPYSPVPYESSWSCPSLLDCSTIPGAHAKRLPSRRGTGTAFADDDEGKTKVPNCSLSSRLSLRSNRGPVSQPDPAKWSPGSLLPIPPRADRDGDRGDDGEGDSDAEDIVTGAQCPRPNSWTADWPSASARLYALARCAVWRCCSWWTFARNTDTAPWCPGDVAVRERAGSSRSRIVSRIRDTSISYLERQKSLFKTPVKLIIQIVLIFILHLRKINIIHRRYKRYNVQKNTSIIHVCGG